MYDIVGKCACGGSLLIPTVGVKNPNPVPACNKCFSVNTPKNDPKTGNNTLRGYGKHGEGVHISTHKIA